MASAADPGAAPHPSSDLAAGPTAGPTGNLWTRLESRWLLSFATLLAVTATVIMLADAFGRGFLGHSYFWAEESVRYLMIWAFFLSVGAGGRAGTHIRTEMLVDILPPRGKWLCNLLASLAGLAFGIILFLASIPQVERYYTMGMMTESTLDLPMWVLFLAMPVGALLIGLYYLGCVVRALMGQEPFAPLPGSAAADQGEAS
ncbi:TRAP transporter small permease [Hansschlegelia sp. KR7-227]|uniref:TRAP transporter small permease n=1 Tax=Hansschlegelia sp. KR7-227 TaxID=3400914 RepID=UPI003C08F51C